MPRKRTSVRVHADAKLDKIRQAALDLSKEVCNDIVDEIEMIAPRGPTGLLKVGYFTAYEPASQAYTVRTMTRYWRFVEFGTYKDEAQPHIVPAVHMVQARRAG